MTHILSVIKQDYKFVFDNIIIKYSKLPLKIITENFQINIFVQSKVITKSGFSFFHVLNN